VYAEDAICLCTGQHLDEAGGIALSQRAAVGGKGDLAGAILDAFVL
jgi:hypothetical protein